MQPEEKEEFLCIFGASTTWGAWDLEKGGWANRLRLYIDSTINAPQKGYIETYNLGISGHNSRDHLKRFKQEAETRGATMIIFSSFDNDAAYITSTNENMVPIEESEENLRSILTQAKEITDRVLVVGMKRVDETKTTPVWWRKDIHYTNEHLERYGAMIEGLCTELGIPHLEMKNIITLEDLADGLHLNEAGHEKNFMAVRDWMLENKWI